ncbi:MAG TPA: class I SAM-dependent methyltransferase [bacterium]|nr:class I SAM-dependent methyltransferase [bacterium]
MTSTDSHQVRSYYDTFSQQQLKTGVNIRHRTILRNLKQLGLRRDSAVLEIGCGIGILTRLLGGYCHKGIIVATDISPKCIELAQQHTRQMDHVRYHITDMDDFSIPDKFDFILLADVLEHIPLEKHTALFATLKKQSHQNTAVAINIPDPFLLEWYHAHEREKLQIIDQPLHANLLLQSVYANDFYLETLYRYALHTREPDYQ